MKRIGIITIGQSPRSDVVPAMAAILGPDIQIVEAGAIDDVETEIALDNLAPRSAENLLVSRLRDGRQVALAKERIVPRVQHCITRFEQDGVNTILLLCTAQFPHLEHRGLLLESDQLIGHFVSGVLGRGRLGVLVPESDQAEQMTVKWATPSRQVVLASGSPYGPIAGIEAGARRLRELKPDLIVLDCVGYRLEHKALVAEITKAPVILSNTAIARMLAELL